MKKQFMKKMMDKEFLKRTIAFGMVVALGLSIFSHYILVHLF